MSCHGNAMAMPLQDGRQTTLGLWRVALRDGCRYHGEKMRARCPLVARFDKSQTSPSKMTSEPYTEQVALHLFTQ